MNPFQEKLAQFVEDDAMFNAVKGILFTQCDLNTMHRNVSFSTTTNEELGELARSWEQAREILVQGFKEIEKHRKRSQSTKTVVNPAV